MAAAVDEERRRSRDAALVGARDVLGHARRVLAAAQLVHEALDVEAELLARSGAGRAARARPGGRAAASYISQKLPWAAAASDASAASWALRVHVVERQMAPDVADVVAVIGEQLADRPLGLAAVGALEVAVLDERHRRVVGAADVVALGVDVLGEVEDVLGGAADLARAHAAWAAA